MTRFLWSIPGITVFIYTTNVLFQYGYFHHFGIPFEFVNSSLVFNIIYYYEAYKAIWELLLLIKWWSWVIAGIVFMCVAYFLFAHLKKVLLGFLTIVASVTLLVSFSLGEVNAQIQSKFYVPNGECFQDKLTFNYIIPGFYDGKAILVQLNSQNDLTGFITLQKIEYPCGIFPITIEI